MPPRWSSTAGAFVFYVPKAAHLATRRRACRHWREASDRFLSGRAFVREKSSKEKQEFKGGVKAKL